MAGPIDLHDVANSERDAQARYTRRAFVCTSTGCNSAGAGAIKQGLDAAVHEAEQDATVQVVPTGCFGLCSRGPLVRVEARGAEPVLYEHVDGEIAGSIGTEHLVNGTPTAAPAASLDLPFFTRQVKVVLSNAGVIDPDRIEDYIAHGGYRALQMAVETLTPGEVIEVIKRSGLRGRGGAGYPTGRKWDHLASSVAEQKYVVANGDEGDPGAYMDRTIMETDPHRVLEGLLLAGYATGANQGFIYVRAEYPLAIERLERAIREAKRAKLIGRSVLGSGFRFDISVRIGAGAFVCGEETALMASIQGERGTPSLRPPYPTERGLWGQPTMIQNVETLANVPVILERGAEWFASLGTQESKGTKVFALTGALNNTGLIEVPMGISLREIVEEMGGGIPGGRSFKAAQSGGPSGGCIPAAFLDTPVDYENLQKLGSMMGSGGLVVMDETVSMPEVARFYMEFCRDESCGKCTPCRAGTVKMHEFLDRICEGVGRKRDLQHLESLCNTVRATSLCGLGQSAPNPVFSTLEHFRDEYLELLVEDEVFGRNGHSPPEGAVPSAAAATSDGGAR
ncbi:MAG: NADH-ubiquinone oxidoreductase-F iron-sulfur binding region domain-containing protein [Nitriliruptoraceae bacterium]